MLERGTEFISLGSPNLYRNAAGLRPDGAVHVEIGTAWQSSLTITAAEAEIAAGLQQVEAALADERVARLVADHSLVCTYVQDMDTTRIDLATVDRDGRVTWHPHAPVFRALGRELMHGEHLPMTRVKNGQPSVGGASWTLRPRSRFALCSISRDRAVRHNLVAAPT
jgi:hypothetical protein